MPGGGLCRVGCGVPPQALAPWRAAPAPPHPHPLPQGARGPEGPRGCGPAADPAAAQPGAPGGGVGAQPPHEENPRAGGWARAAQRAHPGWGCGGRSPPRAARGLRPLPLTPALSRKGRGGRTAVAPGLAVRLLIRRRRSPALRAGAWGRSPHIEENPRAGGWARAALRGIPRVHDTTVRTLLRDGVWGRSPHRRDPLAL